MDAKDSDEFDRGVVFYQDKNEVVIGVLLWNVFNHISTARRVVAENRKYDDLTEVAKLFNMYKGPSQGISEDLNNDENTDWNLQLSFFLFEKPYFFADFTFLWQIKCPYLHIC